MTVAGPSAGVRGAQAGVTLIEMMIVLAVIGVATGAATLGLGVLRRDDAVEQEARRLAAAISLGVDQALIGAVSAPVTWDAQGYQIGTGARHVLDTNVVLSRGDRLAAAAIISAGADGGQMVFVLRGRGAAWHVTFDGLWARAGQGEVP